MQWLSLKDEKCLSRKLNQFNSLQKFGDYVGVTHSVLVV